MNWKVQESDQQTVVIGVALAPGNADRIAVYITNLGLSTEYITTRSPPYSAAGGVAIAPMYTRGFFWSRDGQLAKLPIYPASGFSSGAHILEILAMPDKPS